MTRVCTICSHENRREIDRALVSRTSSYRDIAGHYGVSKTAVSRHTKDHLPALLAKGYEAELQAEADKLLIDVRRLQASTLAMLQQARDAGDLRTALAAVEKARKNIELLLETEGRLDRRSQINIHLHPEWIELRATIVEALIEYPAARAAVVRTITEREEQRELEAANGHMGEDLARSLAAGVATTPDELEARGWPVEEQIDAVLDHLRVHMAGGSVQLATDRELYILEELINAEVLDEGARAYFKRMDPALQPEREEWLFEHHESYRIVDQTTA